jgi:hypothetical protein
MDAGVSYMDQEFIFDVVSAADAAWEQKELDYAEVLYAKALIATEKNSGLHDPLVEALLQKLLIIYECTDQRERSKVILEQLKKLQGNT